MVKLFVSNLPPSTTAQSLKEIFKEYPDLTDFKVFSNYGFVFFETEESAIHAVNTLNGTEFRGFQIGVDFARDKNYYQRQQPLADKRNFMPPMRGRATSYPQTMSGYGYGGQMPYGGHAGYADESFNLNQDNGDYGYGDPYEMPQRQGAYGDPYYAPKSMEEPYNPPRRIEEPYNVPRRMEDPYYASRQMEDPYFAPKNVEDPYYPPRHTEDPYYPPRHTEDQFYQMNGYFEQTPQQPQWTDYAHGGRMPRSTYLQDDYRPSGRRGRGRFNPNIKSYIDEYEDDTDYSKVDPYPSYLKQYHR